MKITRQNAEHYKWGENCDSWHFINRPGLSIIYESMPPGTEEKYHYHEVAAQVFYIIKGTATMVINEDIIELSSGEAIEIPAKTPHKIINKSQEPLDFLVISTPHSHGDRINIG